MEIKWGKYIATALVTLCLEAHYRYTPIYGLGFEPEPEPNLNALPLANLPQTPLFRHAKQMPIINSPADDKAPEITKHGDFIYFFIPSSMEDSANQIFIEQD